MDARTLAQIQRTRQRAAYRAITPYLPEYNIPIADSEATIPGYIWLGNFYSCIPHVSYPWDPAWLRLIRRHTPDAMPMHVTSVWQWSNYYEHGRLDEPLILTHHALGRAVRDPNHPQHEFYCEMPSYHIPGLKIPGRDLSDCTPNYIQIACWDDITTKPWSQDLPGEYLPFDHELCSYSRTSDSESPAEYYDRVVQPKLDAERRAKAHAQSEFNYIEKHRHAWEAKQFNRKVIGSSDIEEAIITGGNYPREKTISTTVPDLSGAL